MFALLLLAAPALATIYTTNPTASTKVKAGDVLEIKWSDDGHAPPLATIGVCSVDLCVGSNMQQTCIQNLAQSVDTAKANSVSATIDANVGTDGDFYFIRYTSLNFTDTSNYDQAYQQFSSRFALSGMNGSFTPQVQSQIAQGTGAAGTTVGSTPSATGVNATTAPASSTSSSASVSKSSSSSSSSLAPSKTNSTVASPAATTTSGALGAPVPVALALFAGLALAML